MRLQQPLVLILFILLALPFSTLAQVPKYAFTNYPQPPGQSLGSCGFSKDDPTAGVKYQCIFYPANFSGMAKGAVNAVYIKVGYNISGISPYVISKFKIAMGYTNDSFFSKNPNQITSFKGGLTTVYGPANFTATGIDSIGRWVRVPLNPGSFSFNPERKFVFEVSRGPKVDGSKGFDIMMSNQGIANKYRILGGHPDSTWTYTVGGGASALIMDFGMDLATTGLDAVNNVNSFGLFPNPTSDARFNVSFESSKPVGEALISVTSVTGQRVFHQSFTGLSTTFFREISLPGVAKGLYFVELQAGSDRIVRQVVLR